MVFDLDNDQTKINQIKEQLGDIIDNQIFSTADGVIPLTNGTEGRRNSAEGTALGLRAINPRIHFLTGNDETGTPTGTTDRINLVGSLVIVDHTVNAMPLKFINAKPIPGTHVRFTPKKTRTLTIETGGDFVTSAPIVITDSDMAEFVFMSETETGVTGGAFRLVGSVGGGGGGFTEPVIEANLQTLPTTTTIPVTGATRVNIVLTKNIKIEFTGVIPAGQAASVIFKITQDAATKFTIDWSLIPLSQVPDDPELSQINDVFMQTMNQGTSYETGSLKGGSSGGAVSTWANFPAVSDIDYATFDGTNIDRLLFDQAAGSALVATTTGITSDADSQLVHNVPDMKQFVWDIGGVTRLRLDHSAVNDDAELILQTNIAHSFSLPKFRFDRIDPTPSKDTEFGVIQFAGSHAATNGGARVGGHTYANIAIEYESVITNREASSMIFATSFDTGVTTQLLAFMALNTENSGDVDMLRDVAMNDNRIIGIDSTIFEKSATAGVLLTEVGITSRVIGDMVSNVPTAAKYELNVNGVSKFEVDTLGIDVKNNNIKLTQKAIPAAPAATDRIIFSDSTNSGNLSVRTSTGTIDLEAAGGGGANTTLSNLVSPTAINQDINMLGKILTLDAAKTTSIDGFQTDKIEFKTASSLRLSISNTAILPVVPISMADLNNIVDIKNLNFGTSGVSESAKNQIFADSGGMIFNTPASDRYEFNISGSPNGIAIEEDKIQFLTTGRQHRIDANSTTIDIVSESTNDAINLFPGSGRSNEAVRVQNLQTQFKNNTTGSAYEILLSYTNAVTTGQPAIGNIGFMADDSTNVQSAYVGFVTAIEDDTSTSRDGRMQLVVASNNGGAQRGVGQITGIGMDIQSDAGIMKISFFGETPVNRQTLAANPTNAEISTVLKNLGLTQN